MMPRPEVVFLINLVQDVNIVRPLALLAAKDLQAPVAFLVCDKFFDRDTQGRWQQELEELAVEVRARRETYDSAASALMRLQGRGGVLVAASESSLPNHAQTHDVMRVAPADFLRVTLQHGYECVGFLQSRELTKAHGAQVTFAADVICGWCDPSVMHSVAASERSKYLWTGPTALLYEPAPEPDDKAEAGLVCENLHSGRMRASGDFRNAYMDTFFAFCEELALEGRGVTLRPHPGGQYVLKNQVPLPPNVGIENEPIYRIDLRRFAYGISAPSSVLIDLALAGVPVGVWQDPDGVMDLSFYRGLTAISGLDDWLAFERDAQLRPQMLLERQQSFFARSRLLLDRAVVRERFTSLLREGLAMAKPRAPLWRAAEPERVLFIANAMIPTLQLSFVKPLASMAPEVTYVTLLEDEVLAETGKGSLSRVTLTAVRERMTAFRPTVVVFCRYSGRLTPFCLEEAREMGVPVVFHIDDDLLNVPPSLGEAKYRFHNQPERLNNIRRLLDESDLVYCSTQPLRERFRSLGITTPMTAGEVYCTAGVLRPASMRPIRKIGYMGFDHAADLQMILPAIVRVMRTHAELTFELFGSIPKPPELDEFGSRVTTIEPVRVYSEFLRTFASLEWDIGLCPLVHSEFNRVKANTKWVEYTSVGAAVIASPGMAYDECASDGCGILADGLDEWADAVDRLCAHPAERFEMVARAQRRLAAQYSDEQLRMQVADVLALAHDLFRSQQAVAA